MSKVRINKSNRDRIESYIYNKLNQIVKDQNNTRIGLPTIWDIQFEVEAKFTIVIGFTPVELASVPPEVVCVCNAL